MSFGGPMKSEEPEQLTKYLKALLAAQLRRAESGKMEEKPELMLSSVGLSAKEIAEVLGKNEPAVAKAIQRAAKK